LRFWLQQQAYFANRADRLAQEAAGAGGQYCGNIFLSIIVVSSLAAAVLSIVALILNALSLRIETEKGKFRYAELIFLSTPILAFAALAAVIANA